MSVRTITSSLACLAVSAATLGAPLLTSPAHADAAATKTTIAGSGWTSFAETPGLGTVRTVTTDGPFGDHAVELATGLGDAVGNKGGKPYLVNNAYGDTPLTDLTTLAYSTKVVNVSDEAPHGIAPSLGLSLYSDSGWQGTLVYEPINQADEPDTTAWQTWDATAPDARWWYTKDLVDASNNVVVPRQQTHTLAEFEALFAANPGKYANLRLDPRGLGVQVYQGQSGYSAGLNDWTSLVDGVTVGTDTWDFEDGLGACVATVSGTTYTLAQNCRTSATISLPDGATLDGAGHTITAVEDAAHPNFPGAVIASATGNDNGPAEAHVANLTIDSEGFDGEAKNSGGKLGGILFDRAGGSISNVTVTGISHGNGVQEGWGVRVVNRDGETLAVPRAQVSLDDVKVDRFQKGGVYLDGNLAFTASHLDIGSAGFANGAPITNIAANSLGILRGASGTVTDSRVGTNRWVDGTDDYATGVIVYNAKKVRIERTVVEGNHGDVGISVSNDHNLIDTDLTLACSIVANTGVNDDWSDGLNVDGTGHIATHLDGVRFSGWGHDLDGDDVSSSCGSATLAAAQPQVTAGRTVRLSGSVTTPSGDPATGTAVLLARPAGAATFAPIGEVTVGADGTFSTAVKPMRNTNYQVRFDDVAALDATSPVVRVKVAPKVTLDHVARSIHRGDHLTVSGSIDPAKAVQTVRLQKLLGKHWVDLRGKRVRGGEFSFGLKVVSRATLQLRVVTPSGSAYAAGASRIATVRVR